MRLTNAAIVVILLLGPALFWSCSSSGSSTHGSAAAGAASTAIGSKQPTGNRFLSVEKVQAAVDKALDWTKKGGRATVSGIQELPHENTARADIRFDDFQYNTDMYGMLISKDKKAPPEPDIKDPRYYEKMYQSRVGHTRIESYSGQGVADLKHYNDGRWVLTGIQFGMHGTDAKVEIR